MAGFSGFSSPRAFPAPFRIAGMDGRPMRAWDKTKGRLAPSQGPDEIWLLCGSEKPGDPVGKRAPEEEGPLTRAGCGPFFPLALFLEHGFPAPSPETKVRGKAGPRGPFPFSGIRWVADVTFQRWEFGKNFPDGSIGQFLPCF